MPDARCKAKTAEKRMKMGAGYFSFIEFIPPSSVEKSAGGIVLPDKTADGGYDHSQTTWGRVVNCGEQSSRATCEPFAPDVQDRQCFPLPNGTWIVCRKANHWTLGRGVRALQTHDITAHWSPETTWDQIHAELGNLAEAARSER